MKSNHNLNVNFDRTHNVYRQETSATTTDANKRNNDKYCLPINKNFGQK